jgi:hypothetical protein
LSSGATDCDGIGKTMKYEISASPLVLQLSGTNGEFGLGRDPAVRVTKRPFTRTASLLLFAPAISGWTVSSSGLTERRFRLSHPDPTNA